MTFCAGAGEGSRSNAAARATATAKAGDLRIMLISLICHREPRRGVAISLLCHREPRRGVAISLQGDCFGPSALAMTNWLDALRLSFAWLRFLRLQPRRRHHRENLKQDVRR